MGCAIYARISDDRAGDGAGVARQEADCRALAAARGWTVADVYVDGDNSAYTDKRRPEYRRMLRDVRAGTVDQVVVWHLDRLTRRPAELEEFFDLCDAAGITELASVTGDIDLATHDGRFMARILGAAARKESDDKSRRTRRKHLELAQAGKAVGGRRPFGYQDDKVTVREDEAALIRDASARILAGDSIRAIVGDWNERGIPGTLHGRMTQTAVRRILTSPRIAGFRALAGEVVGPAEWPAIVDEVTWRRVCNSIEHRRDLGGAAGFGARRYLLTGFLVCGRPGCGKRLVAQARKVREQRRRTYICTSNPDKGGCGGIRISAEPLEELVVRKALERLRDLPAPVAPVEDARPLLDDITAGEERLNRLAVDHVNGTVSHGQLLAATAAIRERLELARRLLAATERHSVLADVGTLDLEAFGALSLDRRRAILGELVDRVVISPGRPGANRFDPGRAEILWAR